MNNGNIEDIYIGGEAKNSTKKGKKGIIIIFIILLLILAGMVGAYFYFTHRTTPKEMFINSFANTNVKKFFEKNIYQDVSNRLLEENSEETSKITFSTTKSPEELENFDVSNFELNLTTKNDIQKSKSFSELGLNYSGNELFKASLTSNEEAIAIASEEIMEGYLGVHYDRLEDLFGVDFEQLQTESLSNSEKIDLTQEEKDAYLKKYATLLFEGIAEEKFTKQENISISKNESDAPIDVVSYTLNLTQDDLKGNFVKLLTAIKEDQDFLSKLVATDVSENETEENIEDEIEEDIDEGTVENETTEVSNETNETTEKNTVVPVIPVERENFNSSLELEADEEQLSALSELSNDISTEMESREIIPYLMLGIKAHTTIEKLQNILDSLIEDINEADGTGLKGLQVIVYVSENATEKITFTLPDDSSLDFEFTTNEKNQNDNTIRIAYLYTKKSSDENLDDETITYSAEDDISDSDIETPLGNGFTLVLNKVDNDANSKLKGTLSLIENKEINNKIDVEFSTNGTQEAKTIENEIIVGVNTNESEFKAIIDNSITFGENPEIDDLTDQNCLFIENLSEEERANLIQSIWGRVLVVLTEKQGEMNLINGNAGTSFVGSGNNSNDNNEDNNNSSNDDIDIGNLQNALNTVTKEEAKNALISRVTKLMGQAQLNNEEFTIKDLEDLKIDDYEVSVTVTDEAAIIVVDTYTFKIDKNFIITEE